MKMVLALAVATALAAPAVAGDGLPDTIQRVKSSVVGIGTYQETRRPPAKLMGTGFAVGDGSRVVTNAHVLPEALDTESRERLAVFYRDGGQLHVRGAVPVAVDATHDVAVLRIDGEPLPALGLGPPGIVREGEIYAFTGFPVGSVLGLYPVTHRGMVSAITPVIIPRDRSSELDAAQIVRLRSPFEVYQLDATAYPGNSGSPLYDMETGTVVGVLNSVFVKESKEALLSDPSGISYAIPIEHVRTLLEQEGE